MGLLAKHTAGLATAAFLAFAAPTQAADQGDALLARARDAWRTRTEAPFVTYAVRAEYEFHNRTFDDWFQLTYRATDNALVVHPIIIPGEEGRRLRGVPFTIFGVKIFDTNPDADPIALRYPAIGPADTFGLMPHAFLPTVAPSPGDPTPDPDHERLKEIGRVVSVNREYRVTLAGEDKLRYGDAYHLALTPLRDPELNRLRDLWIAKDTYITLRETVAGLFDVKPYDGATWTVDYVPLEGRMYIQQIRTSDDMHFGIERIRHMQLDFVDYHFPSDVPKETFERWL
jgi:hypothetical protein